jgi:hypothetical protein
MDEYIKVFQPVEQDELVEEIESKTIGAWHNFT